MLPILLENFVQKQSPVAGKLSVFVGEHSPDPSREITKGHVRALGEEDAGEVADIVRKPAFGLLQSDQSVCQSPRVIHQVSHESLLEGVVRREGRGEGKNCVFLVLYKVEKDTEGGLPGIRREREEAFEVSVVEVRRNEEFPASFQRQKESSEIHPL